MAESRVFRKAEGITIEGIGRSVQNFLRSSKGLVVQGGKAGEGYVVQAKEDDSWKKVAGMSSAIEVQISDTGSGILHYQQQEIPLSKNEYRILLALMEQKGNVVSRERLMELLWKSDSFVDENTLNVNVNRLRKKLESAGLSNFITTRFGVGYFLS